MIRTSILAVSLAVLAVPALAQGDENNRAGRYESEGGASLTVDLTQKSGNDYSAAISTTVEMTDKLPGCGGSLKGDVTITGASATMSIPNEGFIESKKESLQNSRFCKVNFKFTDQYTLKLEEVSGCSYYHGASCDFNGTVVHEASGI
ncbi:hypothetical protein [Brucella pituitosa]|uniref:hypothetical protein n=1 Tax=Brucella pituitosa TaxID=571256 RepID=UPI000F5E3806|nr:hypothetical protein ECB98_25410 [Brucellaceae bacterium VT-16-1752]